jgi:hypothetical protein
MILRIMTLGIITLRIMTLRIMTFSIMTLSIKGLYVTLASVTRNISDTQHKQRSVYYNTAIMLSVTF